MSSPSHIPRQAAEWIAHFYFPMRRYNPDFVDRLEENLGILKIKELKPLQARLYSMDAVRSEGGIEKCRLLSSAKKQQRVDFIRRAFFRDRACAIVNHRLMEDLRTEMSRSTDTLSAAANPCGANGYASAASAAHDPYATARSPSGSRKRPNHQISSQASAALLRLQQYQQQRQQRPGGLPPNATGPSPEAGGADFFSSFVHFVGDRRGVAAVQGSRVNTSTSSNPSSNHPNINVGSINNNAHRATSTNSINNIHQTTTTGMAGSPAPPDPESHPQTPTESLLLPQLMQMGFQRQEILDGIRHQTSSATGSDGGPVTVDSVMVHLVTQREGMEEARMLDEARLVSEDQKQEDRARREASRETALAEATTGEQLLKIFPDSWVLGLLVGEEVCSFLLGGQETRKELIEILELEGKSRKWYGWKLPAGYFQKMGSVLLNSELPSARSGHHNNALSKARDTAETKGNSCAAAEESSVITTYLRKETRKLRSGLYELEEQCNGQPKIFLDERPKEDLGGGEVVVIDDDDDD